MCFSFLEPLKLSFSYTSQVTVKLLVGSPKQEAIQNILLIKPCSDQDATIATMEACLCDIHSWMINDKLTINDSKTEFMLIGTKAQLQKTKSATLTIGESIISPSTEPLRNLGA